MEVTVLKLTRIGNSCGVRLPAGIIRRYGFTGSIKIEPLKGGLLLKPQIGEHNKLSWDETAAAMSADSEAWSQWNCMDADGLESVPRHPKRSK